MLFETLKMDYYITQDAKVLGGFALPFVDEVIHDLAVITSHSDFRKMETPGGFTMSVAMTNCGERGWITDRAGYRYSSDDPIQGKPWPSMPASFLRLAQEAAKRSGFDNFQPDACLINKYEIGSRLSLHQDKDEKNLLAPIVSVSLGLPAIFQFGGNNRNDIIRKISLTHGDVVVWGRSARLAYHGVLPLKNGIHDLTGSTRINLTFRQTGIKG